MIRLHWDEGGRRLLHDLEETERFEPFPEGIEQALRPVVRLLPFIAEEIEK